MLAEQIGRGVHQGHRILQLVAEAIGSRRLIERCATPEPAGDDLIQQPVVDEGIDCWIGRLDLHHREPSLPSLPHCGAFPFRRLFPAELLHETLCLGHALCRAEREYDRLPFAFVEQHLHLHGGAGIVARPHTAGEPYAIQCRRRRE